MENIKNGNIVEAEYNTGIYIGEVIEDRHNSYLVQVLAVLIHPTQGDLHNPGKVEGVAFHERKALAFTEKMNAPKRKVKPYLGKVPVYLESLNNAVEMLRTELNKNDSLYNREALKKLSSLEKDFYNKIKS